MDAALERIQRRVDYLRTKHAPARQHMVQVRDVRRGDFDKIAPGAFNEDFPRPIVANEIDTYARHASAALSPLPTVRVAPLNSSIDAQRGRADKKRKVANHYLEFANFASQMQRGADQFYTYGILAVRIDPDFKAMLPRFVVQDAMNVYPMWNDIGETVEVAQCMRVDRMELANRFPTHRFALMKTYTDEWVDVVVHDDGTTITGYAEEGIVLWQQPNPLGKCLWVCCRWPSLDEDIRGRFQDLIWVQIARHAMMMYTMEATANAVEAPIAVNMGDTELQIGPNELIRSTNPQNIRRIDLSVPPGAWQAPEALKQEMQQGAIIPQAFSGDVDQAVVTGKGVQQLMAGYSQQIAFGQQALINFYEELIAKALELDETAWPNESKSLVGKVDGAPYKVTYTPTKDIAGDYCVDVTYGSATGLDPNRQLVFLLQGLGAGIFSKDRVRREMPMDIDPEEEERQISVEALRTALLGGIQSFAENLPTLALQGADPSQLLGKLADAVVAIERGDPVEKVIQQVFPPPPPAPDATGSGQEPPDASAAPPPTGAPAGAAPAPGGGAPPANRGDALQMLMAGLTSSGQPNLNSMVSRQIPATQ